MRVKGDEKGEKEAAKTQKSAKEDYEAWGSLVSSIVWYMLGKLQTKNGGDLDEFFGESKGAAIVGDAKPHAEFGRVLVVIAGAGH